MKRTDPPLVPKRIQIITDPIVSVPTLSSFTVLGDPGCDGLGAEVLSSTPRDWPAPRAA